MTMSKRSPVWRTKDNRKIPITELSDGHLKNIILFLRRAHASYVESLRALEPPAEGGDDCGTYNFYEAYEEELVSNPEELYPIYTDLVHEATFREEAKSRKRGAQ
jgi:hypothetical protein